MAKPIVETGTNGSVSLAPDETLQRAMGYWRQHIADSPRLTLPASPSSGDPLRKQYRFRLPEQLSASIGALCSGNGNISREALLLAVLDVLVQRYSGQHDVLIATSSVENSAESLLPIRVDLTDDPPFLNLARRVDELGRRAEHFCNVPFAALRDQWKTQGNLHMETLSQVRFAFPMTESSTWRELLFGFTPTARRWRGAIDYRRDLFEEDVIHRLARHFIQLLDAALATPMARISQLQLLTEHEEKDVLARWTSGQQGYLNACVHELFEQQAARTPGTRALVFEDDCLTYEDLNVRANRLGRFLRRHGVGPETVVGICLESSIDAVVAVLGVLKAGGAYLSLHPDQPQGRLESVVQDANVLLTITSAEISARISRNIGKRILLDESASILDESPENIRSGVTIDNLAFVRYTSGSTGSPKGVANTHRSISSRLIASPLPDIQAADVCLLNTLLGFGSRLLFPLSCGATVVLIDGEKYTDVELLAQTIHEKKVTSVYLVPSHLRVLLQATPAARSRLARLRVIATGGEPVTTDLVEQFMRVLPESTLVQLYGSNEIGTAATMSVLRKNCLIRANSIGRPVANTLVYVLDAHKNLLPAGAVGEIFVGSAHLARGYLNQPDLTASVFIDNPFRPGERLYRTGDLGRYYADGEIEFLGRTDQQVKIRGFRVELSEVESALLRDPQVEDCAATVREFSGSTKLIAYVVGRNGAVLQAARLRAGLIDRLPDYMIPAKFLAVERIPLTATGKVDRAALPEPNRVQVIHETAYQPPQTVVEDAICEIWTSVMGLEKVGRNDHFLELGGDSVAAARIVAQISEQFELDLPLQVVFMRSTVASLTAWISGEAL